MKKTPPFSRLASLLVILLLLNQQLWAYNHLSQPIQSENIDAFEDFDEEAFYQEFSSLKPVEAYLANHDVTYEELAGVHMEWMCLIQDDVEMPVTESHNNNGCNPFTAFLMGFGCGAIGVLIVHLTAHDKKLTNQALIGCVVWSTVWMVFQLNSYSSSGY